MIKTRAFFFVFFLFLSTKSFLQELPPVTNFLPKEYGAQNQNWSMSQGEDKVIYVANNKGLLVYNGAEWKLYESPNQTIIRSVKVIGDKVFTGSYMDFGYWQKDDLGSLYYTSLSEKIRHKLVGDEQFWNILFFENNVIFQSLNSIYIYDLASAEFRVINSNSVITKIFHTNNTIYYHKLNEGLFKIEGGKEVLISNNQLFKENRIIGLYNKEEGLLVLTQNNGFFLFSENKEITKCNTSIDTLFKNVSVYNALLLKDNSFAIGTVSNGFILLDEKGNLKYQINKEKGLHNNTVLSLFEDVNNDLWLGLDNGISLVNKESPFSIYNDLTGNLGSVYSFALFNNYLYLGTNQGLFYKEFNSTQNFSFIEGTKGQVWNLRVVNNTLFCGHNSGTFIINEDKTVKISEVEGAWDFRKINNNLILQGNYDGLYVLEKNNENWSIRNKIENVTTSAKHFEIINSDQVFINHEYKGVFKLKILDDFRSATQVFKDISKIGLHSSLISFSDKIYYASQKGFYQYNNQKATFEKDTLISKIFENDYISGKLVVANNKIWGFSKSDVLQIAPSKLSNSLSVKKVSLPSSIRNTIEGYENILHLEDDKYLISASSGYLCVDLSKLSTKDFEVVLDKVIISNKETDVEKDIELANHNNNLLFQFSVPEYGKFFQPQYQYRLKGLTNKWSNWSQKHQKLFENLPSGDYNFELRAKVGNQLSKNSVNYSFNIRKPWYATNLMIGFYALFILFFSLFMHNFYRRYYKQQQRKIIEESQKELKLAQVQNEKEIIKIRNEKLREDFKNKSKELASSIMSVVKKNELLTTIKEEVSRVNSKELEPVIELIDKNLKDSNDWEFFQEAFNNADSEFLKRLKLQHPNLSPNDLKLCAYLRLNLSSKEIAPLFNISVRSVEIKRYRLRKKMNLPHESNLVDYILKL